MLLIISLLFLAGCGWLSWQAERQAQTLDTSAMKLSQEVGRIMLLDEVLTMSAKMAAASGDLAYEQRYHAFEPELGALITDAMTLAPDPDAAQQVQATDDANQRLVAMETRAFELTRQGHGSEALTVLTSPAYMSDKQIYAHGMEAAFASMGASLGSRQRQARFSRLAMQTVGGLGLFLLFIAWARTDVRRRRAEGHVIEAEVMEMRTNFISVVSHELRTPMTSIKEGIDIVLDGDAGPLTEEQTDFLQTSKRNVDRLARLINNVLDFQKLESGHMEMSVHEHDLNALVVEVIGSFDSLAKKKGLTLAHRLNASLPPVSCDRDMITQVLSNLLSNAIKFTERGAVTITTERQDNIVRLAVCDQGPGIPPADVARLFQAFSQLSTGGFRKTGGTGLGLAISKQIIEKHRGKIGVESVEGQGATFFVLLPIQERRG